MRSIGTKSLVTGVSLVICAFGQARTIFVANNGTLDSACGSIASPCRSITQAIVTAADGDTILVGPGRYGDVNGNGAEDPGDEQSGAGMGCAICVDKSVSILSRNGAAVTTIDASTFANTYGVVWITANDTRFGSIQSGFTILGGAAQGIFATKPGQLEPLLRVRIEGNVVAGDHQSAILMDTVGSSFSVSNNEVSGTLKGQGILVTRARSGTGVVRGNRVSGNWQGISVDNPGPTTAIVTVSDNICDGNQYGLVVAGRGITVVNNTISNNRVLGLQLEADAAHQSRIAKFSGNTVVGNLGPGILIMVSGDILNFHSNNIYGNGLGNTEFSTGYPLNCGVANGNSLSGFGYKGTDATNNYWGAMSGPGSDPADAACSLNGSSLNVTIPYGKAAFAINPAPR